jgi:hypothetical protein
MVIHKIQRSLIFVSMIGLLASNSESGATEITMHPEKTYQTIVGWEATADLTDRPNNPVWRPYRKEMLDKVVAEVGINRVRLEIRSGAETSSDVISRFIAGELDYEALDSVMYEADNDNSDPWAINWDGFDFAELDWHIDNSVLPMMQRLEARGEKLFVNLCYVAFRAGRDIHHEPQEYAEFVLATYLHMRDRYGFVPDSWEVILEPDHPSSKNAWDGRSIGQAIVVASRRLTAHGFSPAFVTPSVTDMRNAVPYLDAIASVPGAMENVVEFSYHRYRGRSIRVLQAIAARAQDYGISPAMLEWWFGKGTYEVLHEDLKIGSVSAWQGTVIGTHFEVDGQESDSPILTLKDNIRYIRQYFHHIRSGAVRIEAISDDPIAFDPLGFVNMDGTYVVVVKAREAGRLSIRGLPAGRYTVSYTVTTGSERLVNPIAVEPNEMLSASIPGAGVIAIAGCPPQSNC